MSIDLDSRKPLRAAIAKNLKEQRELAGFSQEIFAERLGISRATLSAIENGHIDVDSVKLGNAARLLGRPIAEFFTDAGSGFFLQYRAAADSAAPQMVRSRFEASCKAHQELEEVLSIADNLVYPPEYTCTTSNRRQPLRYAAQVAYSERRRLGLGHRHPIENIFKLLDEQGVRIVRHEFPEDCNVFGVSAFSDQCGLCILVNKKNTVERQTFSLAHEYGHLVMHRSLYRSPEPAGGMRKDSETERMADVFAACLLVPEAGLKEVLSREVADRRVSLEDVVFLKHHFRVSAEMLLRRLKDTELISSADHARLLGEANARRQDDPKKEVAPLSERSLDEWELMSRFQHLVRKAAVRQLVSVARLADLLGINADEVSKTVDQWRQNPWPDSVR